MVKHLASTRAVAIAVAFTFAWLLTATPARGAELFVIEFKQGDHWVVDRSYENQPGIEDHLNYWQTHYLSEVLLMSGPFEDQSGGIFVIRAKDLEAAQKLVELDPGVVSGKIMAEVRRWRVLTSAMRSVRPQVIEIEPDQSFKVERLDPGAPINLPGN